MLTAHDSDADTVLGLDSGANDYVGKPFRFAVLLARIRVHLRQYEASEDAEFQIGPYVFRPASKNLVDARGARLRLTEKEAAILRFLHRANEQAVGRDMLLKHVWGYNANVTTHTLETHIYRLRQKIEANPAAARLLVTDDGGYKLLSTARAEAAAHELLTTMWRGSRARARSTSCRAKRCSSSPSRARGSGSRPAIRCSRPASAADAGYFVLSGAIVLIAADGESERSRRVEAGALIGEMALMAEVARPFAARAAVNAVVLKAPREVFRRVLLEFPAAAVKIRQAYAARTRKLTADLDASRLRSLDRVARPKGETRRAG